MSDLLNSASLVMIPSGYKEDVVYSQIPTDGSGDLSFTRASNGTRVNSAGLVEVVPWNLWADSNIFTSTNWNQYQLTPTTGTTSDIYGNSSTVYKLIGNVTNSYCFINRSSDGATNTAFSVYAKPNGYTKIGISNRSGGAWNFVVDLVTKVVSNIYDSASSIVSINVLDAVGDWKRIEVVVSTAIQYNLHPLPSNFNSTNFDNVTLNGTDGVWVMGAQVNIGSTVKPYFPTTDRLNVPRLTYQNGGGGCPSLLLEVQRTNLLKYSEDFANAIYELGSAATITSNTVVSPDGTQNADTLTANGTGSIFVRSNVYLGTAQTCSNSLFVKKANNRYVGIRNSGTVSNHDVFDFDTKTWTNNSGATLSYDEFPNGWFRLKSTNTDAVNLNYYWSVIPAVNTSGVESTTASNLSVYIWGGQAEQNASYATSYIPTTSSSATRVADACSKTGISSLIGQTEGTIFLDFVFNGYMDSIEELSLTADSNNRIGLYTYDGTATLRAYIVASNYVPFEANVISLTIGQRYKVAFAYKSGDCNIYVNGVTQLQNSNSFTIGSTLNAFRFNNLGGTSPFYKPINETVLFPTRLTNAELASLTTI